MVIWLSGPLYIFRAYIEQWRKNTCSFSPDLLSEPKENTKGCGLVFFSFCWVFPQTKDCRSFPKRVTKEHNLTQFSRMSQGVEHLT